MTERGDLQRDTLPVREPAWGADRSRAVFERVEHRIARSARVPFRGTWVAAAVVTLGAAAALAFIWGSWPGSLAGSGTNDSTLTSNGAPNAAYRGQRDVRFDDGSTVQLLDEGSALEVKAVAPERVEVALSEGSGRFDVEPKPERAFVVHAGNVSVEVLGTAFTVTRRDPRVHVAVERGRVRVRWPEGERVLEHDEAAWFPPRAVDTLGDEAGPTEPGTVETTAGQQDASQAADDDSEAAGTPTAGERSARRTAGRREFLEHHQRGEYREAFAILSQKPDVLTRSAQDLMLAADAARLSNHPAEAVRYLKEVTEHHPGSGQASLAAFTLGRIYLYQLGKPGPAADAFGLARRLAPQATLAHDALAREVEAAHRAGAQDRARRLAKQYLEQYPDGRRADAVRRFGGME